jgi:fructose-specific phosphotransferase system IIC component
MSIKEKPHTKNVTVIGFCVISNGALPNSASNSQRLIQALANRRLLTNQSLV